MYERATVSYSVVVPSSVLEIGRYIDINKEAVLIVTVSVTTHFFSIQKTIVTPRTEQPPQLAAILLASRHGRPVQLMARREAAAARVEA